MADPERTPREASERFEEALSEIRGAVIGGQSFFEDVLLGIMARGHVLMEDVPGTGKTLTARTFADVFGLEFSRIQFTPDLLPADITGTSIFNEGTNEFEFQPGPIFANVVLADEINRAPPKTQAAMLEAMAERQVTVEGETRDLPEPFFVIATQNPIEQEGTFPLPEAQVDRFMVKTELGYPDKDGEVELLRRRAGRVDQIPAAEQVLSGGEEVISLQEVPESVHVDDDVLDYVAEIARRTREDSRVRVGVSPRGTQRLFEAARARAVIEGRAYATPGDVKAVARPVLAHRIVLTAEAQVGDGDKDEIVRDVLDAVSVPTVEAPAEA
ncbi:MAG: AAA family ATPase [Halobacteriales archaeon]